MYLVYKHRRIDTHPAKNRPYTATACKACLHRRTHTSHAHYAPHAAMQAGAMVEWIHDLRPVFEVRWGREWEVMDLCVMTCFTGTLPFSVTPAHLWRALHILILFIQSWQPCMIPTSPLGLCLSWFSFFFLSPFVGCIYFSASVCRVRLHPPLTFSLICLSTP